MLVTNLRNHGLKHVQALAYPGHDARLQGRGLAVRIGRPGSECTEVVAYFPPGGTAENITTAVYRWLNRLVHAAPSKDIGGCTH